nr:MAG TPA: hypothetical protein [Caudoviricetes sp.]
MIWKSHPEYSTKRGQKQAARKMKEGQMAMKFTASLRNNETGEVKIFEGG